MSEPVDTSILLEDVDVARTQYMKAFYEQGAGRFGSMTNRLVKVADQIASGNGITMQFEVGPADIVRTGTNALVTFDSVGTFKADDIQLRFNSRTPSSNDFTSLYGSVQYADILMRNGSMGTAVDIAQRTVKSVMDDFDEKLAILRNIGRNGVLALVNGTPTLNNGVHSTTANNGAATGTATNSGGLRCKFDGGIYPAIKENGFYDFIRPATGAVVAGNVYCTDKFEGDSSAGFAFQSTQIGSRTSTGNLASVADNDYIVLSSTYNAGLYGFGAYFSAATASESFIGGVDRTTSAYRHMIPINPRYGATSATVTKSLFDDVSIALGNRFEDMQAGLVCQSDLTLTTKMRNELGEESFIQISDTDTRAKKFYNFGSWGLNYQHPSLGIIKINADALCPSNTFRFIDPSTWICQHYAFKGFDPMPGTKGNWYRVTASTPNTGDSTIWKSDYYTILQDWCTQPKKNAQISNVSAS